MSPVEITDFLLARIAEDREAADHARWAMQGEWFTTAEDKVDEFVRRNSPARVLAECEAKRRIVEEHPTVVGLRYDLPWVPSLATDHGEPAKGPICATCAGSDRDNERFAERFPCMTLRLLALPYADHPDYREEWKP